MVLSQAGSVGGGLWGAGLVGLLCASLVGCAGPRLKVPSDLGEDMDVLVTKGRQGTDGRGSKGFSFGPYRVEEIQREWSSKSAFESFEGFTPLKDGGYRYRFAGAGEKSLTGMCAVPAPEKTKELDGSVTITERDATIACLCQIGKKTEASVFVEDLAGEFGGPVVVRDVELRATGLYQLQKGGKHPVPAGYQIDSEDGPVGGVEVLPGKARVWIREGLRKPDQRALACALSGLMLFQPEAKD